MNNNHNYLIFKSCKNYYKIVNEIKNLGRLIIKINLN